MKTIKKTLCLIMTVLFSVVVTTAMAGDNIKVKIGGEPVNFDVQPQLINNRTMVPLRAIFEALGATVDWNGETQTVTSTKGDTTISLTINNPVMTVNGAEVTLDSPACLVDGRTLVPVRAISEAFNLPVEWVDSTKTVKIKKKVSVIADEFRKITDFVGQTWKYTYDDSGLMTMREHDAGLKVLCEYDDNENLVKETFITETTDGTTTDVTNYTYDSNGNLLLKTDVFGWTRYEYDNNLLKSWTNDRAASCDFTYDENGRLIMETYSTGSWTKYEYNENGMLIGETSSSGYKCVYEYDGDKLIKKSGFDSNGENIYTVTYEYDRDGNLVFESSSSGSWSRYIQVER